MLSGRKEARVSNRFSVQICTPKDEFVSELSTVQDVSPSGLRVVMEHSRTKDSRVLVKSSEGDLWAKARVVYCQRLDKKTFVVGLELLTRTGGWIMANKFKGSWEEKQ